MSDESATLFDIPADLEPGATSPAFGEGEDPGLRDVLGWFRAQRNLQARFGSALRQSLDEVLDGQRTGRFDIESLDKTEKTYLGTKVEIVTRATFDLPRGLKMDYRVAGHDVDAKFSLTGRWAIPTEAMGHLCLLISADDHKRVFDVGLIRISAEVLNPGRNQDHKTTITKAAKESIHWLCRNAPLPGNLLLALPYDVVRRIMSAGSGQKKINELLRQVQGRIIDRNTAVTVAQQQDGLKRCRDARPQLASEGIVVLGHQKQGPIVARALELPVPEKGTFVSVRVVPVTSATAARPAARIGDGLYAVAHHGDLVEPAPQVDS